MTINKWRKVAASLGAAVSLFAAAAANAADDVPAELRFACAGGPRIWILGKIDQSFDKALATKVKWIPFASGSDVLSLFTAKEIDIARFGSSPAVAGSARKLPSEITSVPEIIATSERLIDRSSKGVEDIVADPQFGILKRHILHLVREDANKSLLQQAA